MNTNEKAAAVIGARHQRAGRNGQDAAVAVGRDGVKIAVVCDGCSSGASSEVGARLGAMLFARVLADRLSAGECVRERSVWEATRAEVGKILAEVVTVPLTVNKFAELQSGSGRSGYRPSDAIHDHLLFTIVAAAITHEGAAIWALGDGAYSVDGAVTGLGPFENNEPPYLAYDLLGNPAQAHFEVLDHAARIIVATDGIDDLERDFSTFTPALVAHPDGLRRKLAQLSRSEERIDWLKQRVIRAPAVLQDDLAIAIIEAGADREASS
jgi:hypothetical protein